MQNAEAHSCLQQMRAATKKCDVSVQWKDFQLYRIYNHEAVDQNSITVL